MMDFLKKLDKETISLLESASALADTLKVKAYLVGGPVRDLCLGIKPKDIDIVIEGQGITFAKAFAALHKGTVTTYQAFKTATVKLASGRMVDFATARKEVYARPGAFPKVMPATIREDLFRRDFTVNAMAIALNKKVWGKLVDPYSGMKDLKNKRLRVLHDKSFIDDPTRILRAARFQQRFGFHLERHTENLCREAIHHGALTTIKPQRYKKEHDKNLREQ